MIATINRSPAKPMWDSAFVICGRRGRVTKTHFPSQPAPVDDRAYDYVLGFNAALADAASGSVERRHPVLGGDVGRNLG